MISVGGRRWTPVDAQERQHQKAIDRLKVEFDLLVPVFRRGTLAHQLEAIQGALAREHRVAFPTAIRTAHVLLPDRGGNQRIPPQVVVIAQILVTESKTEEALRDELFHGVLDPIDAAVIGEALDESAHDSSSPLDLAKWQRTSVGSDRAAVEPRRDLTPTSPVKVERSLGTLCTHEAAPVVRSSGHSNQFDVRRSGLVRSGLVRNAG